MTRRILLLALLLPLAGCISVHQTPLPSNQAVAVDYPGAAAGDGAAQLRLASAYRQGWGGVDKNEAEMLRRWLGAAEAGNAEAQMLLAGHYRAGDRERAAYWFLRAAESGHRQAPGSLAALYADTRSGPPDYPAALAWAYVAGNTYQINTFAKQVTPEAQVAAQQLAEQWKSRLPAKDKK